MSDTPYSDALHDYFNKRIKIEADIDASGAKKGAEDFDASAKMVEKSQKRIKGTTKVTTEFDTKGLDKFQRDMTRILEKLDKTLGSLGKNMGNTLGHNLEKSFNSPTVTKAVNGIGERIKTSIAKSMVAGTAQARGELAQNIKALQKSVVEPINDMLDFKSVKNVLGDIANSGEMKRFTEIMEMMNGDRLTENLRRSLSSLRDLSLRDKRMLGLLNQDTYNLSDKGSMQVASDLGKQEKTRTTLLKSYYAAREKEAKANTRHIENQDKREQRAEERELRKEAEQRQKAEQQRLVRQQRYRENVGIAVSNAQAALLSTSDYDEKRLTDNYNRAVARIRGIYQSAVVHGRVENPETIQAGIAELQRRSLELNNYRLEAQLGIKDINDQLKTTVRRTEDMGTRWNKISSVLQNSVQAFSTMQSFAYRITSTITRFARTTLSRIASQIRSLVSEATTAFKSLEVSMIGFRNFFGEENTERLYQSIKSIAARAPGLATTDLADYVRQIAPVSGHNPDLALNAALGMLKTIQYGGASGSTEMEYVIKNIRDVLAKGKATAIDIRQFNRAMPILEEVLESVGQSQLLKDGVLTINKDNVDTILTAFAELNTSNQSAVKDIFDQMNNTLSGQWEQFREQFTTNLMEALRGAGVYGLAQNAMMQINNGAYVQDALARLRNGIAEFINGINWFQVQRVATEVIDGLKIIWKGFEDAFNSIKKAVGVTQTKSIINSFSSWIADIIRGMGEGIAQIVRFLKELERMGVMNTVSKFIGWFGSVGSRLVQFFGTMFSHITNIAGNLMQVVARFQKRNLRLRLEDLNARLEAIPIQARSQMVTSQDLLNGTGVAATNEVTAINNLTNVVNSHLMKIEANQAGSVSTLGKVETAFNNGKQFVWTDNFDGAGHGAIGTWNKKTKNYDWSGYSNNAMGYARYQQLTTQNFLQASNSAFLQRVGSNKVVDSTIKWMRTAGAKILSFAQKLLTNVIQGATTLLLTETITMMVESLNLFGDATKTVTGLIKAAGYAITGAIIGRSFGNGVTGGVVGALVGLGIGIASVINTIKEEERKLANTKLVESMDEADQAMYDQTVALLQQYGFNVDKESIVGAGALQQLAYYIKSTPVANRSTEEAIRYYNEAYKMLSVGYKLDEFANSSAYQTLGGTEIDLGNTSGYWFGKLAEMVRKYGLAEEQGYYYGNGLSGRGYYRDEDLTEQVPAEEMLKNAFPNGVTDEQAKALLNRANELDEEYGKATVDKLEALLNDNQGFKTALDRIDQNVADILRNVVDFLGKATPENLGQWFGETAKTQAEGFESHANGWERFLALMGVNSFEYQNEGYGTERGMDKVYYPNVRSKLGQEFENAVDSGDSERAGYLGDWINQVDSYEFGGYSGWLKDWISFILEKLTDYNNTYGRNFRFAHGGIVPAFAPMGIDTVPAMLSPGEFVMKSSAVRKTGLGVMHALNRGDLGSAARALAQNVSNRTWNRNNTSTINSKTTNYNTNNFRILNKNTSARMNSYYSLANRLV